MKTHSGEKSKKCNQCDYASSRAEVDDDSQVAEVDDDTQAGEVDDDGQPAPVALPQISIT